MDGWLGAGKRRGGWTPLHGSEGGDGCIECVCREFRFLIATRRHQVIAHAGPWLRNDLVTLAGLSHFMTPLSSCPFIRVHPSDGSLSLTSFQAT